MPIETSSRPPEAHRYAYFEPEPPFNDIAALIDYVRSKLPPAFRWENEDLRFSIANTDDVMVDVRLTGSGIAHIRFLPMYDAENVDEQLFHELADTTFAKINDSYPLHEYGPNTRVYSN